MNVANVIKIGLIVVIVLLFALTTNLNKTLRELESEKNKNDSVITKYETEKEDKELLSIDKETIVLTAEQKAESNKKSLELGNKVCEYQNAYFTITDVNDKAFEENVNNLRACFNTADNGSAAVPWYSTSATVTGKWSYVANTEDGGRDGLWLCRNEESGVLLAYAMADYNYETGLFDALTFSNTFAGNAALTASESVEEEPTTQDPIVNEVQEQATEMLESTEEVQYNEDGEVIVTTEAPSTSSEEEAANESARAANIDAKEKITEEGGE